MVFGNLHHFLPEPWSSAILTLIAMFCGAVIGAEREKRLKPVGLRTMILISFGSAVFTMLSVSLAGAPGDPSRIAAQIVSGIGFLGAGAILRGGGGVRGLTTAATVWAAAAIGVTVGAGYAMAGLALACAVVATLLGASVLENHYLGPCTYRRVALWYHEADGKAAVRIDAILDEYQVDSRARRAVRGAEGDIELQLTYCNTHKHHKEFLARLAALPEVRAMRYLHSPDAAATAQPGT